jgi:hypothetical protein
MQNEPNSTNPGYKLKGPPKADQLNNQLSLINNQWKGTQTMAILLPIVTQKPPTFTKKCAKKLQKMHTFCKFLIITHLTPCTPKAYKTFHPKITFTTGVYQQFVKREKMKNKPNSKHDLLSFPRKLRIHDNIRATRICKTNPIAIHQLIYSFTHSLIHPIMKTKPNLQAERTYVLTRQRLTEIHPSGFAGFNQIINSK